MATADVYRCVTTDGKTFYGDAPCPRGAAQHSNITAAVGACTTTECAAQREQLAAEARERLRADQEQLADFADRQRRNEIAAENERIRVDTLLWRQEVDARLAAMASEPGNANWYAPYYSIYPVYPALKPCGWRCVGLHRRPVHAAPVRRTWGTALRLDRR